MIIKNISKYLAMAFVAFGLAATTACSEDDPFFTADENDAPRILNTDIPEGKGGEPGEIANIERTQNFTFEVKVTPVHYTTVKWYIDDEEVAQGLTINVPVVAGDHIVKIVATTTKGLSTSRTCKLTVRPADGDPELATDAKSRWLTSGKQTTIQCKNVTSVSKVFIGKAEATGVSYADGKLTFTVPSMADGDYTVTIVDASGMRYGCGVFTVSSADYVDPGIKETILWEGSTEINWGDSKVFIPAADMADVPVGATIRLVYEMVDAEYHCMRVTNEDWSADMVAQFDLTESGAYEFEFTADSKAIADAKGMLVTGFGYKLTQVVIVEGVAPAEETLWEGSKDINWGDSNVFIPAADMAAVAAGSKIHVYYEMIDAEYHAMRITNEDWSADIVAQFDITPDTANPFDFEYTADSKAIGDDKGMLVTGFGYKITKVTYSE
jgi:hypothetical protein